MIDLAAQMRTVQHAIKIGSVEVTSLQDGKLYVPRHIIKSQEGSTEQQQIKQILPDPLVWSNNVYLIKLHHRFILIDTGGGDLFPPESGQLVAALASVGVHPKDITDICLTHLHPDHIGGLVVDRDIVFTNATLHVSAIELDYWLSADSRRSAPNHHAIFFEALDHKFLPYYRNSQVQAFENKEELFPGLRTQLLPGHTPGLSAFFLSVDDKKLLFWGDLFNEPAQIQYPNLKLMFDWNSELAMVTRIETLELAAQEGFLVASPHVPFPGFSTIEKQEQTYQLRPFIFS